MKIFNIFKRKKQAGKLPLKKLTYLQRAATGRYVAEIFITFNDSPIGRFTTSITANSRHHAQEQIEDGCKIKVHKIKKK